MILFFSGKIKITYRHTGNLIYIHFTVKRIYENCVEDGHEIDAYKIICNLQ
jgi:hypothetical protein